MNPFIHAEKYLGTKEIPGSEHNPQIVAWIQRAGGGWIKDDETPWCSAFVYFIAWDLGLPRPSKSGLRARSWLEVGTKIPLADARAGDVVIFQRGGGNQPGADVLDAPGHVALFAATVGDKVIALGGNQGDAVTVAPYPAERVLGARRLA